MFVGIAKAYTKRARSRRGEMFRSYLQPSDEDRILDLGGGNGAHLASIVPYRKNVYIADISQSALDVAEHKFGFKTILLNETGQLPFDTHQFDIVFCSSVIEHVTVEKDQIRTIRSDKQFYEEAYPRQQSFAEEIRRIGRRYFVQTPYKYFPIESHTWLPVAIVFLPRAWQIRLIDSMNQWWPKTTSPDWNLLTNEEMQELFPDAEVLFEKSFGFTKSLIAVKR
jgi:SAM-dependent methyltransferase